MIIQKTFKRLNETFYIQPRANRWLKKKWLFIVSMLKKKYVIFSYNLVTNRIADSSGIRIHNHLVQKLNHLVKLAK